MGDFTSILLSTTQADLLSRKLRLKFSCLLPPRRETRNHKGSPSDLQLQLFILHPSSPPRLIRAFMSALERLTPTMHMPSMPRSMPSLLEDSQRNILTPSLLTHGQNPGDAIG